MAMTEVEADALMAALPRKARDTVRSIASLEGMTVAEVLPALLRLAALLEATADLLGGKDGD
jgi:hypothetical protein